MCEKQISTENGILTCDLPRRHGGMHHALHEGGKIPDPWGNKGPSGATDIQTVSVGAYEIEWPQDGMNDAVQIRRGEEVKVRPNRKSAPSRGAGKTSPKA